MHNSRRGEEELYPSEIETLLEELRNRVQLIERYGVKLQDTQTKIKIIEGGTERQQAAALYTASVEKLRNQKWDSIQFYGISREQATWIINAAAEDGILELISFEDSEFEALKSEVLKALQPKPKKEGDDEVMRGPDLRPR